MTIILPRSSSLTDGFVINGFYILLALLKNLSGCACCAFLPLAIIFLDQSYTQNQILALLRPYLIHKNKILKKKVEN